MNLRVTDEGRVSRDGFVVLAFSSGLFSEDPFVVKDNTSAYAPSKLDPAMVVGSNLMIRKGWPWSRPP